MRCIVALQNWLQWALTFITVVVVGMFVFPFLREHPKSVHEFFLGLQDWQRLPFIFAMSVLFTEVMFRLFKPRLAHLRHFCICPPTWLAWLLAIIVVAAVDLAFELGPDH